MSTVAVPPRSAGYAPAVKVMAHGGHAEAAVVVFHADFKDSMQIRSPGAMPKRIRLDPRCLEEAEIKKNGVERRYELTEENQYAVGFSLYAVPHEAESDCCAISVQTHGFIDLAITNKNKMVGQDVTLTDVKQPPTDIKTFSGSFNPIIGTIVCPLAPMPADPPNVYRVRVRLVGGAAESGAGAQPDVSQEVQQQ